VVLLSGPELEKYKHMFSVNVQHVHWSSTVMLTVPEQHAVNVMGSKESENGEHVQAVG
jgi:hypothetical protein